MVRKWLVGAALALAGSASALAAPEPAPPLAVRVVVVTAFEIGADTGDAPGEFQAWASVLPQKIPFPAGVRDLRYDPATHVLAISTGEGTGHAAASIMALGSDPRFDLTHAYWLVAAIAGVNPDTASAGSAAWIGAIIDTDFSYLIDPREVPANWPTGFVPMGRAKPYAQPVPADSSDNLFPLNTALRDWAYRLTRDTPLPDTPILQKERAHYSGYPLAQAPPKVLIGDEATGQAFWLGARMNRHTERWVSYWTGGTGRFVMSAMEDSGIARSLAMLGQMGKAAPDRLMVLRTASDYTLPPPGMSAARLLARENTALPELKASLDAAYQVGSRVVGEIAGHWDVYAEHVPGAVQAGAK